MKKHCTALAVVLISFVAFGVANADVHGVMTPGLTVTRCDSVKTKSPDMLFLTTGWGSRTPEDTADFIGVSNPESLSMFGTVNAVIAILRIYHPIPGHVYRFGGSVQAPPVTFYGDLGVEDSRSVVEPMECLNVSPSVVTGQMTVRLEPFGTARPVVQIHDAAGNVVRSLNCRAGNSGTATATWNREDDFGRLVPEGVYFCRYAASGTAAVRKVLVAY